jgi:predicted O-methyltransferase YrrM
MKLEDADQADFEYLRRIIGEPDALMLELEAMGAADGVPIIDREVGRFLSVMVSCMLAGNILEIGTAYGCSTLWMARAQPETGRIWTIDPDVKRTEIARGFFRRASVAERIEIINQPALDVLGRLPRNLYDIVLIDALKEEYSAYLDLSVPLVKHSGLVIVDNLLWHHRAAEQARADDDEATKAIRAFNEKFIRHPALNATILPLGDGLGVGAKTK